MNDNWGLSDEELDGLFRQAADGQRPRFDPEDWRQMAARLDAAPNGATAPRPKPRWRRTWWLLAGLLLFTGVGVVWWVGAQNSGKTNGRTERIALEKTPSNAPSAAASPAPVRVGAATRPIALPNGKPGESATGGVAKTDAGAQAPAGALAESSGLAADDRSLAAQPADRRAVSAPPAENRVESRFPAETPQLTPRLSRAADTPKNDVKKARNTTPGAHTSATGIPSERTTLPIVVSARSGGRARSWEATGGLKRGSRAGNPTKAGPKTAGNLARRVRPGQEATPANPPSNGVGLPPVDRRFNADNPNPTAPATGPDLAETRPTWAVSALKPRVIFPKKGFKRAWPDELVAPEDTLERRVTLPPVPRGRFGLRAVLSPDLNSVNALKSSAFGNSYGLLVEYELLPRWRVQTGVIRSQKDYAASTYEYSFQSGYWTQLGHPRPDEVDAKCTLFDVPINLRFDVLRRSRFDVFVSAGVSTYLMNNEKYLYRYAGKPNYIVRDSVQNGGGRFANTLNFSVGYQRQLGEGFSLQVEPYLKLPLATVGFGSVRLYSLGMHLSLAFHPLRRSPGGR